MGIKPITSGRASPLCSWAKNLRLTRGVCIGSPGMATETDTVLVLFISAS